MSTISQLREAYASTLETYLGVDSMTHYREWPETVKIPCTIIEPEEGDYTFDFAGGAEYRMCVVVLVQRVDVVRGQRELDQYVSNTGTTSVPKCIRDHSSLGLTDSDAMPTGMDKYEGLWNVGGIQYVGARVKTKVVTGG